MKKLIIGLLLVLPFAVKALEETDPAMLTRAELQHEALLHKLYAEYLRNHAVANKQPQLTFEEWKVRLYVILDRSDLVIRSASGGIMPRQVRETSWEKFCRMHPEEWFGTIEADKLRAWEAGKWCEAHPTWCRK